MIYVFDSSFIGALIIPDEKNPLVDKLYEKIDDKDEIYVPHLLYYEIANLFNMLSRRRRFTINEVMQFFPRYAAFQLIYDSETGINYSKKLLCICNDYNISAYDAAYLELAKRKKAILCTLDLGLQAAAKKCGILVLK